MFKIVKHAFMTWERGGSAFDQTNTIKTRAVTSLSPQQLRGAGCYGGVGEDQGRTTAVGVHLLVLRLPGKRRED